MSYAVRNDGTGWRSIDSSNDVGNNEFFSETQPAVIATNPDSAAIATALERSDVTILRCVEVGIAVPAEWLEYRRNLRKGILQDQPVYPLGT